MKRIVSIVVLALAAGPMYADCLFTNDGAVANSTSAFRVSPSGVLEPAAGSPFATGGRGGFGPATRSLAAFGRFLYVLNPGVDHRILGSVAGFEIQPDCSLLTLPGSPWPAAEEVVGIAIHERLRALYVASYGEDRILRFAIASNGGLTPLGDLRVGPGRNHFPRQGPFDLALSKNGRFLFATHFISAGIGVYRVARDGSLLPIPGSPFHQPAMWLQSLTLSGNGRSLYAIDPRNSKIHGLRVQEKGTLVPMPGSPWRIGGSALFDLAGISDLELSANDRFLFAANRAYDSIGSYELRRATGAIAEVPSSPFPATVSRPVALERSEDGQELFVANFGTLAVHLVSHDGSMVAVPEGVQTLPAGRTSALLFYLQRN